MSQATANPNLREFIAPFTEGASEALHKTFPNVEADHLSALGAGLVAVGALIAISSARHPGRAKAALAFNLVGVATDAFNGALARVCYADDPARLVRGNKVDSLSDFLKDLEMGAAKIGVTNQSGSRIRRVLAEAATITTPLTSLSRAYMEGRGYQIEEHGNSPFEFFGTRGGRTGVHAVSASNVRVKGVPVQPVLDGLITAANVTRITKNLKSTRKEAKSPYAKQKARFRTNFHAASALITTGGILAARKVLK